MMKPVKEKVTVFEYELPLKVERLEEGGFLARSNILQGVLAEGREISEAVTNAIDVAAHIIEIREEKGLTVPLKILKKSRDSKIFNTKVSVQVASV